MGVDELFRAFLACRRSGDAATAKLCIQYFAFRMRPQLLAKALRNCDMETAEEVVAATIESVLRETDPEDSIPFRGDAQGELHNWVYAILRNRIADHYRTRDRRASIASIESLDGGGGEDGSNSRADTVGEQDAGFDAIALSEIREAVLADLNPDHRRAVEMSLAGFTSAEIAERVGTSANNVDQIKTRYRKHYREALLEAGFGDE